eukprot:TRINITY_DN380_c0_g1_i1.p1 TRINITY_DN380_c0_g1~~TRINITY_DN380_c0_g1_i1.p1  ORF type:complete len:140 (+),score=52.13 TRINITY_DN380_c0_g1_i1:60-479(+)
MENKTTENREESEQDDLAASNPPKPKAWLEWEEKQKALVRQPKPTDNMPVKLVSREGKEFEVKRVVAEMSTTIANMLVDIPEDEILSNPIPLPNIAAPVLEKVVKYCDYHHQNPPPQPELPPLPPIPSFEEKKRRKEDR